MVIGFLLGCVGGAIIMGCICLEGHDQIVARLDARIASLQAAVDRAAEVAHRETATASDPSNAENQDLTRERQ